MSTPGNSLPLRARLLPATMPGQLGKPAALLAAIVLFLAALGTFASYASASAQATPAALVRQAHTPSTLTLPHSIPISLWSPNL